MRKFIFQTIYTVLVGLSIYSCSELILPKQVWLKGTVNAPIKVGAAKLNVLIAEEMNEVFASGKEEGTVVYNVDYEGQMVQTFCIKIPIEMTKDINPNNFLKIIDEQINGDTDGVIPPIPYVGDPRDPEGRIPIGTENNIRVALDENKISGYVYTIDFGICQEDVDSGIGLNFHFDKIPAGLAMKVECVELNTVTDTWSNYIISPITKPLHEGVDTKFGNEEKQTLNIGEYQNDDTILRFTIKLQSVNDGSPSWDPDLWNPAAYDGNHFVSGDMIEIKGEMSVFHVWTKAEINLANALKASSIEGEDFGRYPAKAFDLSRLGKYFEGEFDFNDLEVKIYMDGPDPESINDLDATLEFSAQYHTNEEEKDEKLYHNKLFMNSKPIKLDDYLNEDGFYRNKDLPGGISEYEDKVNDETVANIFKAMPDDLYFIYKIHDNGRPLTIYPESADDSGASGAIKTTIMIMLPMSLTAKGDADNPSTLSLPDMFGNGDLFGRDEPKNLFGDADVEVDHIRMTVDFHDEIFTNGYLFINREKELFPQGIPLNNKGIAVDFTDEQLKEVKENLIVPSINIEFDREGTVNILKDMGILGVKFEMKGLINIGEM